MQPWFQTTTTWSLNKTLLRAVSEGHNCMIRHLKPSYVFKAALYMPLCSQSKFKTKSIVWKQIMRRNKKEAFMLHLYCCMLNSMVSHSSSETCAYYILSWFVISFIFCQIRHLFTKDIRYFSPFFSNTTWEKNSQ